MVVHDSGLNRLRDLLAENIEFVAFWQENIPLYDPAPNTSQPAIYGDVISEPTTQKKNKTLQVVGVLPSTSGLNDVDVDRAGTRIAATGGGTTGWNTVKFTPIQKTAAKEIHFISTNVFQQE